MIKNIWTTYNLNTSYISLLLKKIIIINYFVFF